MCLVRTAENSFLRGTTYTQYSKELSAILAHCTTHLTCRYTKRGKSTYCSRVHEIIPYPIYFCNGYYYHKVVHKGYKHVTALGFDFYCTGVVWKGLKISNTSIFIPTQNYL